MLQWTCRGTIWHWKKWNLWLCTFALFELFLLIMNILWLLSFFECKNFYISFCCILKVTRFFIVSPNYFFLRLYMIWYFTSVFYFQNYFIQIIRTFVNYNNLTCINNYVSSSFIFLHSVKPILNFIIIVAKICASNILFVEDLKKKISRWEVLLNTRVLHTYEK